MALFCYLCFTFVFVILSCLFCAALMSPAGRGLASLALLCVMFSCVYGIFPYGDSGQVLYMIVLIPVLCLLHYLL